jgi:hypothetical protein
VVKQEYNFEQMIRDLIENPPMGLTDVKKGDILISSFQSYFRKVIKSAPRSASTGAREQRLSQTPQRQGSARLL